MIFECVPQMPTGLEPSTASSNARSNAQADAHKQSVWHNHVRTYERTYRESNPGKISSSLVRDAHEFGNDFLPVVDRNA